MACGLELMCMYNHQRAAPFRPPKNKDCCDYRLIPFIGVLLFLPASCKAGEIVTVITQSENGWWDGMIGGPQRRGWFPYNYVRLLNKSPRRESRLASL